MSPIELIEKWEWEADAIDCHQKHGTVEEINLNRQHASELRAALAVQPQNGPSVRWWWRDSTNEWVLEICASGEDHNACVRYRGKTKDDAIEKLLGGSDAEQPLTNQWREGTDVHEDEYIPYTGNP